MIDINFIFVSQMHMYSTDIFTFFYELSDVRRFFLYISAVKCICDHWTCTLGKITLTLYCTKLRDTHVMITIIIIQNKISKEKDGCFSQ